MSRNNVEHFDQKGDPKKGDLEKSKKIRIEKWIILGALLVILMALFVIPKCKAYAENKGLLAEKISYDLELPDAMSEETYLNELNSIGDQLDASKKNLPENIDTIRLYEVVAKKAESCQLGLISVKFDQVDSHIDDTIGGRIEKGFSEKEEKTIKISDGKFLTSCKFNVTCVGNDDQIIAFLNELNQCQPMIRVLTCEIEADITNKKTVTLKLESFAIQEEEQFNKKAGDEKFAGEKEAEYDKSKV